jgi:hypothetical protein
LVASIFLCRFEHGDTVFGIDSRVERVGLAQDVSSPRARDFNGSTHRTLNLFRRSVAQEIHAVDVADEAYSIPAILFHLLQVHARMRLQGVQSIVAAFQQEIQDAPEVAIAVAHHLETEGMRALDDLAIVWIDELLEVAGSSSTTNTSRPASASM